MPLLDIAIAQPFFQNHLCVLRVQALIRGKVSGKFTYGNKKKLTSAWKSVQTPKRVSLNVGHLEVQRGNFLIEAVATLEAKCSVQSEDGHNGYDYILPGVESIPPVIQLQSSGEELTELDEREKLRRMRISKANKGNTPWNKGRKHSAETLRRIRERTKLAMQDPKVKMKLVNLGHAQSKETRMKIGIGVRMGWQRRRERLMLQEMCYFEWQNLIAEASREGCVGEEELQWDSYRTLDQQLEQEWLESVERRRNMPRPKGSKRAPKSLEQRRKISEAISAKWADPEYRKRVCSALAKYHGTPVGAERKPRRRPSGHTQSTRRSPAKKKPIDTRGSAGNETNSQSQRPRLKRSNTPVYKDPLVSSKLEMIKNIRAQRAAAETKKNKAMERAKLLIAEAEKASKVLEVAASRSPLARSSLMEARKLLDEAVQLIESVERRQIAFHKNSGYPSLASLRLVNYVEGEAGTGTDVRSRADQTEVNGVQAIESSKNDDIEFKFGKYTLQNLLNCQEEVLQINSREYGLPQMGLDDLLRQSGSTRQPGLLEPNGTRFRSRKKGTAFNSITVTKKWVRGRLVEVAESD